jgi:hypothetical protein
MTPTDQTRLPLRWEFVPVQDSKDRSVRWKWRTYTQTGALAVQSTKLFDSLTECTEDAKAHGYSEQ